jgi:histidinol dehydrogenase
MLELIDGRAQAAPIHVPRPRPVPQGPDPLEAVRAIVDDVRARGDEALVEHTRALDAPGFDATRIRVGPQEIAQARRRVRPELLEALEVLAARLEDTCRRARPQAWIEERVGELVGQLVRPLRSAGIYAPGGRAAYPSSVLMAAVPARVAGVERLALATPPDRAGEVSDAILAACALADIDEVYRLGGAQAIAALAYGSESVRPVDKIVGPGNLYVTLAKRLVAGWVGVDSEAGPTEIAIVADGSAEARVVAADLIAQAEHGPLGSHVLITWDEGLVGRVIEALDEMVPLHERADDVESALTEGGRAVLVRDLDHALETANAFAPEHLELVFPGALDALDRVTNAGAVFVGAFSAVPAGDYVAGTNHILPSGGTARFASGLGVDDFVKKVYVCGLERAALERLAPHIDALSEAEGLHAHARAVRLRLGEAG